MANQWLPCPMVSVRSTLLGTQELYEKNRGSPQFVRNMPPVAGPGTQSWAQSWAHADGMKPHRRGAEWGCFSTVFMCFWDEI